MVAEAQRSRAPIQGLADKVAGIFVPAVLAVSVLTFVVWLWIGPEPRLAHAIVNAVAVLIIACPCALGLATPMSIMVGVGRGAQEGVLVKNAEALEQLEKVTTLVVDKTGTLTEGKPKLMDILPVDGLRRARVAASCRLAGAEQRTPTGRRDCPRREAAEPHSRRRTRLSFRDGGRGRRHRRRSCSVWSANRTSCEVKRSPTWNRWKPSAVKLQEDGKTAMFVAIDGKPAGILAVADPIKATTAEAIKELHALGLEIVMLTGDNRRTAAAVVKQLGLDAVEAEIDPAGKVASRQEAACGRQTCRDGRRRYQRRAGAQRSGSRHCHGHRHRRGDAKRGHHPRERRPPRHCQSHSPESRHHVEHPAEPGLRFSLQRIGHSDRGRSALPVLRFAAQPDHCRSRDESEFSLGHQQRSKAAESETVNTNTTTLKPESLGKLDAYWRAANYLSVGQIFLYDNPKLEVGAAQ